jgi:hypothetical protein
MKTQAEREAEWDRNIQQDLRWMREEAIAYINAANWLHQAAAGEVPHGTVELPRGKP